MVEKFISAWNGDFLDYQLKAADLKEPQALMGALVQVFDRLGLERAVLAVSTIESPEDNVNDSMLYYRDLLPVINMTRVVNHVVSVMPQEVTISMMHFLQPTVMTSHSILLLLYNLMVFNEDKLRDIAPYEEELFTKSEQGNRLVEHKNKLIEMLNGQAQEKALRAKRLEKLEHSTVQLEQELKEEMAACNAEQQVVDDALRDHRQLEVALDQKRGQRDAALADLDKKKALRVYDAEDVKSQVEQATHAVAELEERMAAARATLMGKEDSLKNLQTIKPSLDAANSLLRDICKLSETLLDMECGDLEWDSQEGELAVLGTELGELQVAHRELQAARDELQRRTQEAQAQRALEGTRAHAAVREATEKDERSRERCERAAQRTEHIKQQTQQYEADKARGMQAITDLHDALYHRLQSCQVMLTNQMVDLAKRVEDKKKMI